MDDDLLQKFHFDENSVEKEKYFFSSLETNPTSGEENELFSMNFDQFGVEMNTLDIPSKSVRI